MRTFLVPSREAAAHLDRLAARARGLTDGEAARTAKRAVAAIRARGDAALDLWRRRYDGDAKPLTARLGKPKDSDVSSAFRRAFDLAVRRVSAFHRLQKPRGADWRRSGSRLFERAIPLDSAGVYLPGGEAVYVSTAIMTIVPARIAGVPRIAAAVPGRALDRSPEIRWALARLGVTEVYRMGGAHAIAAFAVGTRRVAPVAKIVGPGNRFVAAAKREVSGLVGIDAIAGPTEIAIFADGTADPDCIAADLLAQAEHDRDAAAVLATTSARLGRAVEAAVARRLAALPAASRRRAAASLSRHGAIAVAQRRSDAVAFLERIAPEHLEVQTADYRADARLFRRAGAIFAGRWSGEVFGDYAAGSNHVLPTNGTARFASALSVRDFVRFVAVVELSERDARALASSVATLADAEGLPAHAAAARLRREGKKR
jgi:histidinol dehydrogenase